MAAVLILAALFALLLAGVDIAFALAGLGIALLAIDGSSLLQVPQALMSSMDNFILLAVPLFILMSNVLLRGGAGARRQLVGGQDAAGRGQLHRQPAQVAAVGTNGLHGQIEDGRRRHLRRQRLDQRQRDRVGRRRASARGRGGHAAVRSRTAFVPAI